MFKERLAADLTGGLQRPIAGDEVVTAGLVVWVSGRRHQWSPDLGGKWKLPGAESPGMERVNHLAPFGARLSLTYGEVEPRVAVNA